MTSITERELDHNTDERAQGLAVRDLHRHFTDRHGHVRAVDGVTFEVPEGALYTLLGPSGCGKTTTLRCVAGLEPVDQGTISVDGEVVNSASAGVAVPPHQRDIGMVFQSYGIWPHMTVFKNAAFPLEVVASSKRRLSKQQIRDRVEDALRLVQLSGLEDRMATQLSGGQQQRLALVRALVREPKLLLLDEPLSNLDAKLREAMRAELSALQQRLGLTTLYVTHDQAEALSMSTRIAVMSEGKIVQEGTAREIYQRPATRFVADFVGTTNFVEMIVGGRNADGTAVLRGSIGAMDARCPPRTAEGEKVLLTIRPENLRLHSGHPQSSRNILPATVEQVLFLGSWLDCYVRIGDHRLIARDSAQLSVRAGDEVHVELPVEMCTVVSDHGAAHSTYERTDGAFRSVAAADEAPTAATDATVPPTLA